MPRPTSDLFLPQLVEPVAGAWTGQEVDIQDSAVDAQNRKFWVPKAHTPAQRLARLHELGHVKYSPRDWDRRIVIASRLAAASIGKPVDTNAVHKIQKMLEENRIDWLLWDRHGIDLRPSREVLDWGKMPDPSSVLQALGMSLQLAWTVWASRGLGTKGGVPNPPPVRAVDPDTAEYFDKCWSVLCEENEPLGRAMIRACMRMYSNPTHEMRDMVAGELSTFFPLIEEEEEKAPAPKKEEKEKQEEAEAEEKAEEEAKGLAESGMGSDVVTEGRVQYHDHTATVRRPSMRIARRTVPVTQGPGLRFAHRYFVDKAIFGQRLLTEAGIMIDGSSSMRWEHDDLEKVIARLPAVKVGVYASMNRSLGLTNTRGETILGRICIIAKDGRFATYNGTDPEMGGGNEVDLEALQLLAKWPKPRLWLSDGEVCGGLHVGPARYHEKIGYYEYEGALYEKCDALMKQHEIYRVPNREVMHRLLKRERVTLYRSCTRSQEEIDKTHTWGKPGSYPIRTLYPVDPQPITFQL